MQAHDVQAAVESYAKLPPASLPVNHTTETASLSPLSHTHKQNFLQITENRGKNRSLTQMAHENI